MRFIDEAEIYVEGGKGGNGCTSFLREKFRPMGGPDGGDGGDGGTIILEADDGLATLQDIKLRREFRAEAGVHGKSKNQHGRCGSDTTLRVPVGTVIWDRDTGEQVADLTHTGDTLCIAHGGRGGKGNARFMTRTNRGPTEHEEGLPGESRHIKLELKLVADVGLIGLPNAGKSTLLSAISSARPKIADYPFTTLQPMLGIVVGPHYKSFTVADIPGLIEGAHQGHGLGIQFLRHIERTRVLVHLLSLLDDGGLPYSPEALMAHYTTIRSELAAFDGELDSKPELIAFTKIDSLPDTFDVAALRQTFAHAKKLYFISAPLNQGVPELLEDLGKRVWGIAI